MMFGTDLQSEQVITLWQSRDQWWQQDSLDLSQVERLDSAGLALLVKWAKAALARGSQPQLINATADIYTLATLYGVVGLFQPIAQKTEDA